MKSAGNETTSTTVSGETRGASPIRGIRLFRAIGRRLARRSRDADSRSSSSDSGASDKKGEDSGFASASPRHTSSSSSDAGSDVQARRRAVGIRRAFQSLSLNAAKRKSSKKAAPQRILRPPVAYTYVRGLSGLPTQRVPKSQTKIYVHNPCGCAVQYMAGLDR